MWSRPRGTADDRTRLLTALGTVHASRRLPPEEQRLLGEAIGALSETIGTPGAPPAPPGG
ncbi:hypothetical protein [Streptomyces marincola]|uniref:hypothetical protein n=1 Tax=Streptomyces marincola TaxID=2878388 RepID=UPI001CF1084E|nr:hypothetical protein [Streptomyces marincola]UCM91115.1 hypothetical protein LC193_25980 [Streptomyces marincola]